MSRNIQSTSAAQSKAAAAPVPQAVSQENRELDSFLENARVKRLNVDLTEQDDAFLLKAEVPGARRKDITVQVDETGVLIHVKQTASVKLKKGAQVIRHERGLGEISRLVALSDRIDESKVKAKYKRGLLMLRLPKKLEDSRKKVRVA